MRFSPSTAFWLLGALAPLVAADGKSDVHVLDASSFKPFFETENTKPVLLKFYAPWCGHCKTLAPKFEEAAAALKDQEIRLAKIDCTESNNAKLCADYGVEGYPTLKVVTNNNLEKLRDYNGARNTPSIVAYMEKRSQDPVQALTADTFDEFKAREIVFVAFHKDDDSSTAETFKSIATEFFDQVYRFGAVSDPEVAKAEGVTFPSVVAYKTFDDAKTVYDGKIDPQALASFVKLAATPLVGEVGPDTYTGYSEAGIPLVYIFAETKEERTEWAQKLSSLARKLRGKLNIATIDAKAYGQHAENVNLKVGPWPALAIQDFKKNKKFALDQAKEVTHEAVESFIKLFSEGKVEPTIKSEPVPDQKTQDASAVTILVAHNFNELVRDNEKDVLVEYYAPWCGHCNALAPIYEELASKYKKHSVGSQKVTIAKIDATANDIDAKISGFPTIKLYPAGNKNHPVDYSGSRTAEDFAKFIAEKGTHSVNAYDEVDEPEAESESASEASSETAPASESSASSSSSSKASEAAEETETLRPEL